MNTSIYNKNNNEFNILNENRTNMPIFPEMNDMIENKNMGRSNKKKGDMNMLDESKEYNGININAVLGREELVKKISQLLTNFQENCQNINFKKGIYIYGSPGSGKTYFITKLLNELGYDVIKYDAGDVRNKTLIDTITSNNISSYNVLDMLKGKRRRIAIVMDEIDGMNSGDKGGITSLIKLIRQKKTKKQKMENITLNPIICISNYFIDKKISELMKVCNVFELHAPTSPQMTTIVKTIMPKMERGLIPHIVSYIQGDMRKLNFVFNMYTKRPELINTDTILNVLHVKSYNDDSKNITASLFAHPVELAKHNTFMNETERTIVALLWHENVVDIIAKIPKNKAIPFYLKVLNNICYADYIDRITFQNQIWIFNEMTSLLKTFCNNSLFHIELNGYGMEDGKFVKMQNMPKNQIVVKKDEDVRFTKVLTKYTTEYNNMTFINRLCHSLDLDKKDIVVFFQEMRLLYGANFCNQQDKIADVEKMFDGAISKLDIKRMYRYLDKGVNNEPSVFDEDDEY